ncbi:MAG: PilZ domain-containing protein [Nitrospinae bacterium]|nr:PilZ domain-containing protein [Nitrospinota bacterium]
MFQIGKVVTFEITGKKPRAPIVGWKLTNNVGYLITDQLDDTSVQLRPGEVQIISLEEKGTFYRISVVFIDSLQKTGMLFVLKGDDDNAMMMKTLRQSERFQCVIPASVGGTSTNGEVFVISDLSLTGISFQGMNATTITQESKIALTFNAGGLGEIKSQSVKVIRNLSDARRTKFAAHFEEMTETNKKILGMYLDLCRNWMMQ